MIHFGPHSFIIIASIIPLYIATLLITVRIFEGYWPVREMWNELTDIFKGIN